ncbi:MAG: ABC-2 type transport system permease protein [Acidimicrobiales bacterium]
MTAIQGTVSAWAIVKQLVRRSLVAITRVPAAIGPILIMPIFFMIAFAGSYSAITNLPGFPTDNIFNWFVPYACIQGAAFGGMGIGFGTARDIEGGFYDRLLLAPSGRGVLLLGPLGTSVARSTFPLLTVFPLGLVLGADWPGFFGLVLLMLSGALFACATGLWALGIVFRLKSQRAMGLVQVGIFSTLFLSIGQVPLAVMDGWLHGAARVNPATNIIRMARQGFLDDGVQWHSTWPGLVAGFGSLAILGLFAITGLRRLED